MSCLRLCVTGTAGRIGGAFLTLAQRQPELRLRILRRAKTSPLETLPSTVECVEGDLSDPIACDQFLRDQDVLIHLAWSGVPLTAGGFAANLLDGLLPTLQLLDAARRRGGLGIVFPSSGGTVYADTSRHRPHTEDDPCAPTSPYGVQKLAAEQYLRILCAGGANWARILRISNAYGWVARPEERQGFIGIALACVARDEPIRIIGDPRNIRDYVHRDDVARALLLAATCPSALGKAEVLNVGSATGTSVRDVIMLIEEEIGRSVQLREEYWEVANNLPGYSVLDIGRAASILGWEPRIGLREGIRQGLRITTPAGP